MQPIYGSLPHSCHDSRPRSSHGLESETASGDDMSHPVYQPLKNNFVDGFIDNTDDLYLGDNNDEVTSDVVIVNYEVVDKLIINDNLQGDNIDEVEKDVNRSQVDRTTD